MSTESHAHQTDGDRTAGVMPSQSSHVSGIEPATSDRRRNLLGPFLFAFLFCAVLVYYGIDGGGIWVILSYTRILDILIDSGLVAYTDAQMGLVQGLPDLMYYVYAQEPIHWTVLGFVGLFYFGFYLLKMVQFHAIARVYGLKGGFGAHSRAYLYGQGLHRILPYGGGDVAVVSALAGQGEDPRKASSVVYVQDQFIWFEIVAFTLIGIALSGWLQTFLQIIWPLVFLGAMYYLTRGLRHRPGQIEVVEPRSAFRQVFQVFASQPWLMTKLCLISLLAFFLDDMTPFLTSQAMTSGDVILHVPFLVIQGGVVGGYLASRIPITPNGIGQYEFGFCMALDAVGFGFATSMTIVIIDGMFRHGVPLLLFTIMRIWHGIETNMNQVLDRFATESTLS